MHARVIRRPDRDRGSSDCTYVYDEAGNRTVTSTILWTGTYTVNGAGPYEIETAIARTDSFDLAVAEAQALNTEGRG